MDRNLEADETLEHQPAHESPAVEIRRHVSSVLSEPDRSAAKTAARAVAELARDKDNLKEIVDCGAVPALLKLLRPPQPLTEEGECSIPNQLEVEEECAYALSQIAVKPEYQHLVVEAGGLPPLIDLLKKHKSGHGSNEAVGNVIRRACEAIYKLCHQNNNIRNLVRIEGGIPPLVELLKFYDSMVQSAAAGVLKTLAFKNDENKNEIVECNNSEALPDLVVMLQSEVAAITREGIGVITSLVHSSPRIMKLVLFAGALQPIINLLSSTCLECKREAALLLGQFATADSDCKAHIVQRGALRPLIKMLKASDLRGKEMSAFAIGRLAQDKHNRAGIAQSGGIVPLLKLLELKDETLQQHAVFVLYGLAHNEENIVALIKLGLVQQFQDREFLAQQTKDFVEKTFDVLEGNIGIRVLGILLYLMRVAEKDVQCRVVLALAHLCIPGYRQVIHIEHNGLELLLGLLESKDRKEQRDGSLALHKLATKAPPLSYVEAAPLAPNSQMYMDEQYVNNQMLSDITFLVDSKPFYAHRNCLCASSEAFRAMLDGGYRERDVKYVEIPNIRWDVFVQMIRFIYTGSVDVDLDIAYDLLKAADQYLLERLKRQCESVIAQDICVDNVSPLFTLSEDYNATLLRQSCLLFVLAQFDELCEKPWYDPLMKQIIPEMRRFFTEAITKPDQ